MSTAPDKAAAGEAVPDDMSLETVLDRFNGDAPAALNAALSDIAFLHQQLTTASMAMSFGFARGWQPMIGRLPRAE